MEATCGKNTVHVVDSVRPVIGTEQPMGNAFYVQERPITLVS